MQLSYIFALEHFVPRGLVELRIAVEGKSDRGAVRRLAS